MYRIHSNFHRPGLNFLQFFADQQPSVQTGITGVWLRQCKNENTKLRSAKVEVYIRYT